MNPEIIGMVGAAILIYSLFQSNISKLRWWGMGSNLCYIVYSLMFQPMLYSILILNIIILGIHLYKLRIDK